MIRLAEKNEYNKISKALASPELLLCFNANRDRDLQCFINENTIILKLYRDYYIEMFNADIEEIALFLNFSDVQNLHGEKECIKKLLPHLKYKDIKCYSFCKMDKLLYENIDFEIKIAVSMDELKKVYALLQSVNTFMLPDFEEYYYTSIKNHNSKFGEVNYIESGGEIVSTASTKFNGEMIFAVATKENMRGKGCAKAVVANICDNLIKNNQTPYITYMTKNARNLYKKLGFYDVASSVLAEF